MFIDDIQHLRSQFIKGMEEQVIIQEQMQAKFNKERQFFLESAQKGQNNTEELQNTIKQLQNEIQEERDYSTKIWANEQVSLMCQKAMFTFKYIHKSQDNKIEGVDMRDQPEGHIVVSKEEQNQLLEPKGAKEVK